MLPFVFAAVPKEFSAKLGINPSEANIPLDLGSIPCFLAKPIPLAKVFSYEL